MKKLEDTLIFMYERLEMLKKELSICQTLVELEKNDNYISKLNHYQGMIEDAEYHISLIEPLVK